MADKSEKFSWLVRLGFAARGLTYFLLGYMALGTQVTPGSGNTAAADLLQDVPLGTPLLYVMSVGLVAYVIFKLTSAIGLMLFGVFSMAVSLYRIIPEFGAEGLKPSFR